MSKVFFRLKIQEQKAIAGVQRQNEVNAKIDGIEREIQTLKEANTVISGIAEQTNLLAMKITSAIEEIVSISQIASDAFGEVSTGISNTANLVKKFLAQCWR